MSHTRDSSGPSSLRRLGRLMVFLLVAVVVLGVAVVAWQMGLFGNLVRAGTDAPANASIQTSDWYTVKPISFPLLVLASGELEAKNQVEIKSQVDGSAVVVELVDEGKQVRAGQTLIKLADDKIKDRIDTEMLNLERARAENVAAEQAFSIASSDAENQKKAAELKLALSKLDLAKWKDGDDPQKRRELKLALEKAQRTLVRDKRDLELSQELYGQKFISLSELEDAQIKALESENTLATANLNIEVYEKYTAPKDERKTVSDVEQAEAELDRTIKKNQSELEKARSDLASKAGTLRIREETLAKLVDQLKKCVITAPRDGVVVYATSLARGWRRDNPLSLGKEVRFNESLIVLPDATQMVAAVKVHEAVLPQVKQDQPATVNIDARPGRPVQGTVTNINVTAEDAGWINPDLREYMVRIELPVNIDPSLKPGMRVTTQILTGQVEDQLAVPVQAVASEGRKSYVHVPVSNGKAQRVPVKLGPASETYVVIREGLTADQRVLTRKPRPGEVVE